MGKTAYPEAEFDLLKQRLLLRELNRVASAEAHFHIMQEATIAAELAVCSGYPCLVFPTLFDERVCDALLAFQIQEAAFWESLRAVVRKS
jgi:hypothetical protein